MACKDKKGTDTSTPSGGQAIATLSNTKSFKEIQVEINSGGTTAAAAAADHADSITKLNPLKKEVTLPKTSLTVSAQSLAISKRKIIVDQDTFGPTVEQRAAGIEITTGTTAMRDYFRLYSGCYWTLNENEKQLIWLGDQGKKAPFSIGDLGTKGENVTLSDIKETDGSTTFGTKQIIVIQPHTNRFMRKKNIPAATSGDNSLNSSLQNPTNNSTQAAATLQQTNLAEYEYSPESWKVFVEGGTTDKKVVIPAAIKEATVFHDYTFEIPTPFDKDEIAKFTGFNKPLWADARSEYNFLVKPYEHNISSTPEIVLPGMYYLDVFFNSSDISPELLKLVTLDGALTEKDITVNSSRRKTEDKGKKIAGQYFDKYGRTMIKFGKKSQKLAEQLFDRFQHVIVPWYNVKALASLEKKKYLFPMYIDIDFSTDTSVQIAEVLNESKITTTIAKMLSTSIITGKGYQSEEMVEVSELLSIEKDELGYESRKKFQSFDTAKRRMWDLTDLIDKTKEFKDIENPPFILGEDGAAVDNKSKFVRSLMRIIATGKLRKTVKQYFRTYEQMLAGRPAYSETIMYRIEKFKANAKGEVVGKSLQSFFLPNSNKIDVLSFVDTQVKYQQNYKYVVHAYQAVVGTKYQYDNLKVDDKKGAWALFQVAQEPSVMLFEIPYYETTAAVFDTPPVFPDVNIIPYRAIKDELLFLMNGNSGDYLLDPIIISPEEQTEIDGLKQIQKLPVDKVRYKTDDPVGVFQVYRVDDPPEDYLDFDGNMIAAVESDVSKTTEQAASAAAFVDKIEPNKKYWYCFRAIDYHGHFSNPTEVYQVELKEDSGLVFPEINVYEFQKEVPQMPVRTMRKYLQIAPAFPQTLINEEKSGITDATSVKDADKVQLGVAAESAWGQTFKVRVKSRNTGKVIDINVYLTNKNVKLQKKTD